MTNWPWPMGGVQNWFEDLWDYIGTAAMNAVAPVSEWIRARVAWLKDRMDESFTWISGKIGDTWDKIDRALTKGWSTITTAVGNVARDVISGVRGLVEGIGDGLDEIVRSIGKTIKSGLEGISDALGDTAAWIDREIGKRIRTLTTDMEEFVGDAVMGGMDWVTNALSGVAGALGEGLKGLFSWIMESLGSLASGIADAMVGIRSAVEPLFAGVSGGILAAYTKAIMPGSPDEEIDRAVKEFTDAYMARMMELSHTEEGSVPTLSELLPKAAAIVAVNIGGSVAAEVAGAALDLAHPMKDIGFRMMAMDVIESIRPPEMIGPLMAGPVWPAVLIPIRYRFNEMYPTAVPGPRDLTDMRSRGTIAEDEYRQAMKFHAHDDSWASAMLAAAYRTPGFPDLQLMYWRGAITADQVSRALSRQGVLPEFLPPYEDIMERIPGPVDLIRMAVREAFTRPELQVEFPAEFGTWMAKQGYADIWAKYWWASHWVLVPLGQLYNMYHRGIIGLGELTAQLKYHDYTPEWRDRLIELSWNLPGRIDARWMYRWGLIDRTELRDLTVAQGVSPVWADRVAEATAKNQWLTEINRLRDNVKRDYVKGYVTEDQLRANLEGLGYPTEWIEFHVRDAVEDGERELKDDVVAALGAGYLKDLVTEDVLEMSLKAVIVRPQVVQMEMERLYTRKYVRAKEPTPEKVRVVPLSTLKRAFRDGIITESDFRAELEARDYGPVDIDMMVAMEAATIADEMEEMPAVSKTATLGTLRMAFREGVITRGELISELEARDYGADDIDLIIGVEEARMAE